MLSSARRCLIVATFTLAAVFTFAPASSQAASWGDTTAELIESSFGKSVANAFPRPAAGSLEDCPAGAATVNGKIYRALAKWARDLQPWAKVNPKAFAKLMELLELLQVKTTDPDCPDPIAWLELTRLSTVQPNVAVPVSLSFEAPQSGTQLANTLIAMKAGLPTEYLLRQTAGDDVFTMSLTPNDPAGAGSRSTPPMIGSPPVATRAQVIADLTEAQKWQTRSGEDLVKDATQHAVQLADAKLAATADPKPPATSDDPDAPAPQTELQATQKDITTAETYGRRAAIVAAATASGIVASDIKVQAYPGDVLNVAAAAGSAMIGATPEVSDDPVGSGNLSRAGIGPLRAQRVWRQTAKANQAAARRAARRRPDRATRSAVSACNVVENNRPCRWAPDRYVAGTGLLGKKNSIGRYRKTFNGYVQWTDARLLRRYWGFKGTHTKKFNQQAYGFEFGGYPTRTRPKKIWSTDWAPEPGEGGPKFENGKRWISTLPKAYQDNLACDMEDCTYDLTVFKFDFRIGAEYRRVAKKVTALRIAAQGRPNMAIGTPRGDLLEPKKWYSARYFTNYGDNNFGPVTIEAQLTSHGWNFFEFAKWGYCLRAYLRNPHHFANPNKDAADCWFAHESVADNKYISMNPTDSLRLRNSALWQCNPGSTGLNCKNMGTYGSKGQQLAVRSAVPVESYGVNATAEYHDTRVRALARYYPRGTQVRAPNMTLHVWDQNGNQVESNAEDIDDVELTNIDSLHSTFDEEDDREIFDDEVKIPVATFSENQSFGRNWLVGMCYREGEVLDARPVTITLVDAAGQKRSVIRVLTAPGDGQIIGTTDGPWTGAQPAPGWCPSTQPPPTDKPVAVTPPKFVNCEAGPWGDCTFLPGEWSAGTTLQYFPYLCQGPEDCDENRLMGEPNWEIDRSMDGACLYTYGAITVVASNSAGRTYVPVKSDAYEACDS